MTSVATFVVSVGVLLVMLLYSPTLQAPFLVPKFAALEIVAALGFVVFAVRRATVGQPRWDRSVVSGALLLMATTGLAWLVASRSQVTPYAIAALVRWVALLGVACATSVVADDPVARQRVLESVTLALAAVALIGLLQHMGALPLSIPVISMPGSTFGNRNFAAEAMAMGLPLGIGAVLGAQERRGLLVAVALEVLFLAATRTRGAWVGAGVGLGMMVWLGQVRPSRRMLLAGGLVAIAVVLVAAVPGRFNPRDAADIKRYEGLGEVLEGALDARSVALRTRFGLWRRTVSMIKGHPAFGVGPGNWPVVFPLYAEPGAVADGVLTPTLVPRQAHDDVLERTAETGLVGLAALAWLVVGVTSAARRRIRSEDDGTRTVAAAAASSLAALAVLSIASFPLEMPGTLMLSGVAMGLVVTHRSEEQQAAPAWYGVAVLAAGLAVLASVRAADHLHGSRWLLVAERALVRDDPRALDALDMSLRAVPNDERARLRKAQVLLRLGRASDAVLAAHDALALEPFSPHAWKALAAAERSAGDDAAAHRNAARAHELLHEN